MTGLFLGNESRESYEASAAILSFSDGGELRCGTCRQICTEHFSVMSRNDVCPACLAKVQTLALAGATPSEVTAYLEVIR